MGSVFCSSPMLGLFPFLRLGLASVPPVKGSPDFLCYISYDVFFFLLVLRASALSFLSIQIYQLATKCNHVSARN